MLNLLISQTVQISLPQCHHLCLPKAHRKAPNTPCSVLDSCILLAEFNGSSRGVWCAGVAASAAAGIHALWHITASIEHHIQESFWKPSTSTAAQIAASVCCAPSWLCFPWCQLKRYLTIPNSKLRILIWLKLQM